MKDKIRKRITQILASVFLVAMVLLSVSGTAIPNAIADSNDTKQEYKGLNIEQFKELYNSTLKKDSEFMARYTNGKGNGINTSSTKLYVHNADLSKGGYKSIDLTERVELKDSGLKMDNPAQKKELPYRYYLWFKKNEQKTGSAHWHTEKFIGTSKPVGSSYNAKLYDNTPGVISAEVARYEFGNDCISRQKSEGGSHLFNHYEDRLGHNAYDLYVIDLQKYIQTAWSKYKNSTPGFKNGYDFSTKVYLQTVASLYSGAGNSSATLAGGPYYTETSWNAKAKSMGFAADGRSQYKEHYDQVVEYQVAQNKKSETTIHWLIGTAKHPNGNLKVNDSEKGIKKHTDEALRQNRNKGDLPTGNIVKYSGVKLIDRKSVTTTSSSGAHEKSNEDTTSSNEDRYVLTGVRFKRGSADSDTWSFYLYDGTMPDSMRASIYNAYTKDGAEGLKSIKVEKSRHSDGVERDYGKGTLQNVDVENGQWQNKGADKDVNRTVNTLKQFSDNHDKYGAANSYYCMYKYVQNLLYQWEILPTDVYFIYQNIGKAGQVTVTQYFYSNDGDGWSIKDKNKDVVSSSTQTVNYINGKTIMLSSLPAKFQKTQIKHRGINYSFGYAAATYMGSTNGHIGKVDSYSATENNKSETGKQRSSTGGDDSPILWIPTGKDTGVAKTDERQTFTQKIDNTFTAKNNIVKINALLKKVLWDDVNPVGQNQIGLHYYEPLSVHTKTRMLQYRTKDSKQIRYTPILQKNGKFASSSMTYHSDASNKLNSTETVNTNGYFVLNGEKSCFGKNKVTKACNVERILNAYFNGKVGKIHKKGDKKGETKTIDDTQGMWIKTYRISAKKKPGDREVISTWNDVSLPKSSTYNSGHGLSNPSIDFYNHILEAEALAFVNGAPSSDSIDCDDDNKPNGEKESGKDSYIVKVGSDYYLRLWKGTGTWDKNSSYKSSWFVKLDSSGTSVPVCIRGGKNNEGNYLYLTLSTKFSSVVDTTATYPYWKSRGGDDISQQTDVKFTPYCAYEVNKSTAKIIKYLYPICYQGPTKTADGKLGNFELVDNAYEVKPENFQAFKCTVKGYHGARTNSGLRRGKAYIATKTNPLTGTKVANAAPVVDSKGGLAMDFSSKNYKGNLAVAVYTPVTPPPGGPPEPAYSDVTINYHVTIGATAPNNDTINHRDSYSWSTLMQPYTNSAERSGSLNLNVGANPNASNGCNAGEISNAPFWKDGSVSKMQKYYIGYTVTKDGTTTVGDNSVIDYTSLTTAENSRDVKTLAWKRNIATTVFDVYWYVKDTPTITATPHESETPYHWDDTPGGSSTSESSPSPLDGGGKITTTGRIRPHIPGDSPAPSGNPGGGSGGGGGSSSSMTLAEIRKYLASKNIAGFDTVDMGSEGNVILPNGEYVETEKVTQKGLKKITTIKKEYVANELDTNFSTTSYLTKGSFIRNDVTIDYTMDVHKDTPVTDSSGIVTGVQIMKHTYTVPVQMVYYQMGDVTVYEPDSGKMYNYAFPNTDGSLTNRAKKKGVKESNNYDSDTKSNGKNCEEGTRSYHSDTDKYNVKIGMNKQYKDKRTGVDIKRSAECKWYGDNGDISALQKYCLIVSDPIIADNSETEDSAASDDGVEFDDPSPELEYQVTQAFEKLTDKFSCKSDSFTFTKPKWDESISDEEPAEKLCMDDNKTASWTAKSTLVSLAETPNQNGTPSEGVETNDLPDSGIYDGIAAKSMEEMAEDVVPPAAGQCISSYVDEAEENTNTDGASLAVDDTFGVKGIKIDEHKLNSADEMAGPSNTSQLVVKYVGSTTFADPNKKAEKEDALYFSTDNVNKVTLHTPVAVKLNLDINEENNLQLSSLKAPAADDPTKEVDVVNPIGLGCSFTLSASYDGEFSAFADMSTGTPKVPTIDTYKYLNKNIPLTVSFDFPVFVTKDHVKQAYYGKGKKIQIMPDELKEYDFYAPYWATEGEHSVKATVYALNADCDCDQATSNQKCGLDRTGSDRTMVYGNLIRDYYSAKDINFCTLSGKMFDLDQYDISDYPTLQNVFRGTDGYTKSGYFLHSGDKSLLSSMSVARLVDAASLIGDTYPIVSGQKIGGNDVSYGPLKLGYKTRYTIKTVGSMTSSGDHIKIAPSFYYIQKGKGLQSAIPVDLYYKQDIGGETGKLVKVGSDLDKLNSHQTCIGDRELDIDKNTLENTAKDQGYQDSKNFTDQVVNSWWYGDIALPSYSKVYIGTKNSDEGNRNNLFRMSDGTLFSSDLVRGVSDDKIRKCLQQWYGEYYLPADTHAVPIGKYVTEISEGVDFSENYWLRDGYLLVNFKPVSYEGGKEHLLYNSQVGDNKNKKEFINMWNIENRQSKKTDKNGQAFNFNEGDFILYDLDKNVMDDDYSSAGTH